MMEKCEIDENMSFNQLTAAHYKNAQDKKK